MYEEGKLSQCYTYLFSCIWLFVTLWTVARQLLCPWGFSRQEYWSGLPCPPPGHLPNRGIEPRYPTMQANSLPFEPQGKKGNWIKRFAKQPKPLFVNLNNGRGFEGEGIHVYVWLSPFPVNLKLPQHCWVAIPQFQMFLVLKKIKIKNQKKQKKKKKPRQETGAWSADSWTDSHQMSWRKLASGTSYLNARETRAPKCQDIS